MAAPTTTPTFRYVRGPTLVESYIPLSGIQTNPGDLMMIQSGGVQPVGQFIWNSGPEIQNWSGIRSQFLGVSLGQHNSTDTTSGAIPIALNGVFRYPFPAASGTTYPPGTPVSFTQYNPLSAPGSGYPCPQALMQCSGLTTAVGTVVEQVTPSSSGQGELLVNLQSTKIFGPINAV